MGGISLADGVLEVGRSPNTLDRMAIYFSRLLDEHDIDHVFVSGYVAILAGRSRSTEDIDVLIESIDEELAADFVDTLRARGYWGPAAPLDDLHTQLAEGGNIWVAPRDDITPHLEVKFVSDEFDQASLEESIAARVGGEEIPIGPLELQIAYKLYLGTQQDFEDAVHLYTLFEESLRPAQLERWCENLGVSEEYDRLRQS